MTEEIRQFGHYPKEIELTPNKENMVKWENFNSTPYTEAFWKWFPNKFPASTTCCGATSVSKGWPVSILTCISRLLL